MAWFKCIGPIEGGEIPGPKVTPIWWAARSGYDAYFTAPVSGLYLLQASCGYQGTANITLPSGKTPIINETVPCVSGETSRLAKYIIVELEANDVVTYYTVENGQWPEFCALAFLLENIDTSSITVYDTEGLNDDVLSYSSIPSTSDIYMSIASYFGSNWANYRNDTVISGSLKENINQPGAKNTSCSIIIDEGQNFPTLSYYGYDGGGVCLLILKLT